MIPLQQHTVPTLISVDESSIEVDDRIIDPQLPVEGADMKGVLQEVWTNKHVVQLEEAIFTRIQHVHISQLPPSVQAVALRRYVNNEGHRNRSAIISFAVNDFAGRIGEVEEGNLRRYAESYLDPDDTPERKLTRLPQEVIDQIETCARRLTATFGDSYPLYKAGRINRRFVIYLALEVVASLDASN